MWLCGSPGDQESQKYELESVRRLELNQGLKMCSGMTIEKKGQFWVTQHVFGQNENRMARITSEPASLPQTRGCRGTLRLTV